MNILEIVKSLAPLLKIEPVTSVFSSQTQDMIDVVNLLNTSGIEIATRYDWPQLRKSVVTAGGGNAPITLPTDFSRVIEGRSVTYGGATVRGGLSNEEFANLAPVVGTPRYFRVNATTIELWPYVAYPNTITVNYISKNWLAGNKPLVTSDGDVALFDENLLIKNVLYRWRREKGLDFKDYLDEFEGDFTRYTNFASAERKQ